METKYVVIITVACLVGGLAGGYVLASNLFQNQLAAYEIEVTSMETAYNASLAQLQAKDAVIQAKEAQLQALRAVIDSNVAQIDVMNAQVIELMALTQSQQNLIQLMKIQLGIP